MDIQLKTISSYRIYSRGAIRNWLKGRRIKGTSKFMQDILKHYCCPIFIRNGYYYVLDAGCGPGFDTVKFYKAGFNVVGVDAVPEFIQYGMKMIHNKCHKKNIKLICGDYTKSELISGLIRRRLFDLVWANASLIHFRKNRLTPVLQRLAMYVRPGGLLAGTFFHGKGEGVYQGSFVPGRYFARYLKGELQTYIENAGWRVQRIRTVANEDRKGRWIQVIAEKR